MPAESNKNFNTFTYMYPIRHISWSLMGHVGFRWVFDEAFQGLRSGSWSPMQHAARSPMGIRFGLLVFNGSPIWHVGLRWVSNQACWSPMKHVEVSDQAIRSLIKNIEVTDGSPIRHVGLRWVFDGSPIIIIYSWTPRKFSGNPTEHIYIFYKCVLH